MNLMNQAQMRRKVNKVCNKVEDNSATLTYFNQLVLSLLFDKSIFVGQNKTFEETAINIFNYFVTFYGPNS